ncbi:hypothetical protein ABT215_42555 [Streptomyces sp900105755]|uniref:hypothetical protein n=1 Tax=Streptomyces sp. 900105755 TaxID=3154389 RepID=UPI00332F9DD4
MGLDFNVQTDELDRLAESFRSGAVDLQAAGNRFNARFAAGSSPFGQGQAAASAAEACVSARDKLAHLCQGLAALSVQTENALRAGSKLYAAVEESNTSAARSFSTRG